MLPQEVPAARAQRQTDAGFAPQRLVIHQPQIRQIRRRHQQHQQQRGDQQHAEQKLQFGERKQGCFAPGVGFAALRL